MRGFLLGLSVRHYRVYIYSPLLILKRYRLSLDFFLVSIAVFLLILFKFRHKNTNFSSNYNQKKGKPNAKHRTPLFSFQSTPVHPQAKRPSTVRRINEKSEHTHYTYYLLRHLKHRSKYRQAILFRPKYRSNRYGNL